MLRFPRLTAKNRRPGRRARGPGPLPAVVAALRVLDLDHLGAVVPEDLGRERSRHDAGEVDDPKVFERPGHASSSRLAMPLYPALGVSSMRGAAPRRPLLTGARDLGRAGPVRMPASGAPAAAVGCRRNNHGSGPPPEGILDPQDDAPRFRPPHAGPPVARGRLHLARPHATGQAARRAHRRRQRPTKILLTDVSGFLSEEVSQTLVWRAAPRVGLLVRFREELKKAAEDSGEGPDCPDQQPGRHRDGVRHPVQRAPDVQAETKVPVVAS